MVDKRTTLDALGRRQFIFTNLPVEVPSGWNSVALGTGFILHHCPLLCVISVVDRSGRQWALLGHAFEVTESRQNPATEISLASTENVSKLVATWSGRWLLISSAAIIPDAGALLGAYIHENDQGMIISGSVALLASILNLPIRDSRLIGWYGFNWFPGPLSKLEQVRKLLPDQIYNPEPRRVQFFDRLPIIPGNTLEDTAEILIRGLVRVFRAMSQLKGGTPTLLALTAGLDSRTSFSILQASGVPFETFTLQHSRISKADTILPAEISARYGIPYRYVIGGRLKREKLNQYDRHTYYCAIDGDRHPYARGCYELLGNPNWLLRSGCWEVGREYFHAKLRGLTLEILLDRPRDLMERFRTYSRIGASAESIREWVRWRLAHPVDALWQDIFYRDQRIGGWLSGLEQSLDLIGPISMQAVNSDYFYSLLLKWRKNYPDARVDVLQRLIIARCAPELESLPINPPLDKRYFRMKNSALKIASMAAGEFRNLLRLS